MLTKHGALDTLDRLEFFQGQRAGRELWFDKNPQLQDIDIACFVRDISNLREYIQTADVAPRAEWISVEERLPESLQRVLAIDTEGDMFTSVYVSFATGRNAWSTSFGHLGSITHWMPLPEPPAAKGGE